MWRSLYLVLHYDTLTTGETINDSSAALHLRYLQVDLPKECKNLDKLQCPSFLILLRVHELHFPTFRLWTASAPRRTRQWSSRSPSTWWTACWAARPTRRSSRWRKRTPPRRDMLDMDRDMLDGLKTIRCSRWTPRVASEMWLLNFSRTVFLNLWSSWWGNVFLHLGFIGPMLKGKDKWLLLVPALKCQTSSTGR